VKFLGPANRTQVQPGSGRWLPVFTLAGFESWIIRYGCGHGQIIQFREDWQAGTDMIRAAKGQLGERRAFYCMSCPGGSGHVLIAAPPLAYGKE
jgi:hypothetical protein